MCLSINYIHFDYNENKYIPRTADNDLLVEKFLSREEKNKKVSGEEIFYPVYTTPYQHVRIKFKNGQCLQKANGNGAHLGNRVSWEVNQGIHANLYASLVLASPYKFRAVIPKGTNYFIGSNGDVVSEKLLLFETENDFMDYYAKNKVEINWFHPESCECKATI